MAHVCNTLLATALLQCILGLVQAAGLGDKTVWQRGALLSDELSARSAKETNLCFKSSNAGACLQQTESLANLLGQVKVDVVKPNKQLAGLMNLLGKMANSKMLIEYERYYKQMQLDSTSRPMLMTYLGLRLSSDEQLGVWAQTSLARGQTRDKLVDGCTTIVRKRDESFERAGDKVKENIMLQVGQWQQQQQQQQAAQLALLLFKSNLNLFLLENYALLCARLVGDQEPLRGQLKQVLFLL